MTRFMPLYLFEDPITGDTFEEMRSIAKRNAPLYRHGKRCRRLTAPDRIAVPVGVPSPLDASTQAMKGYRRLEEKQKLRQHGSFDAKAIKQSWSGRLKK